MRLAVPLLLVVACSSSPDLFAPVDAGQDSEPEPAGMVSIAPAAGPDDAGQDAGEDAGADAEADALPEPECSDDSDCEPSGPCDEPVCVDGACEPVLLAPGAEALSGQTAGDCDVVLCRTGGVLEHALDPDDVPEDDGDPCTAESCSGDAPSHEVVADGATCGDNLQCMGGDCVTCAPLLDACETAQDCCGGALCELGRCVAETPACDAPGEASGCDREAPVCGEDLQCGACRSDADCELYGFGVCGTDGSCWDACDDTGCGLVKACTRLEDCENNGPLWHCPAPESGCRRPDGSPFGIPVRP